MTKNFIAHNATVIGDVTIGTDSSVWYSAVIRADVEKIIIGEKSNIQDGAILHADFGDPTIIGNGVTVGHRAIIHGAIIGDYSLIGMGATVLNKAKIGRYCIIGANALVKEGMEIPDFSMALGVPAKIVKMLPENIANMLEGSANHYVEMAKRHQSGEFKIIQ